MDNLDAFHNIYEFLIIMVGMRIENTGWEPNKQIEMEIYGTV